MTDDTNNTTNDEARDPALQALFAAADQELAADGFTGQVMARISRPASWMVIGWAAVALLLLLGGWLLGAPLQAGATALAQSTAMPLVPLGDGLLAILLAPVNSLAGAVGLALFALLAVYRSLFLYG